MGSMKISATTKLHGVELDDVLVGDAAKAIAEEIDWGILCDLMTQVGWHKVKASTEFSMKDYAAVKEWLNEHVKGNYKSRHNTWIFEQSKDAAWFALRWA
jgi:hypothetical protein